MPSGNASTSSAVWCATVRLMLTRFDQALAPRYVVERMLRVAAREVFGGWRQVVSVVRLDEGVGHVDERVLVELLRVLYGSDPRGGGGGVKWWRS